MSIWIGRFRCLQVRVLSGIVSIALLILNHTLSFGQQANTYRCSVKDAVTLQDNGSLGKDWNTELERKYHDGFIIDTLTGAITWPEYGGRSIWRKIQKGSAGNDYVFSPPLPTTNAKRGSVYAASDFILVRAWIDHLPVKFVVWRSGTLLTGTCEIVR